MLFTEEKEKWVVPDVGNNLELPEAEQIKGRIKIPSGPERRMLVRVDSTTKVARGKKKQGDEQEIHFRTEYKTEKILTDYLLEVVNVQKKTEDGIVDVKTGKELLNVRAPGIGALCQGFVDEILKDELPEDDAKNS